MMYVLLWINGAAVGALVTAVVLWWRLATGRAVVRPLSEIWK